MGGRGSGRRSSSNGKPETGDSMPLDIRKITRKGLLVPGSGFSWQWLVNDRQVAGITIRVDFQSMVLSYRMKSTGEVVEQRVQMQTSPCHLGGQRHWFTCPRCSKRVCGALCAGPVLCLSRLWWAGLCHAERRRRGPGLQPCE